MYFSFYKLGNNTPDKVDW